MPLYLPLCVHPNAAVARYPNFGAGFLQYLLCTFALKIRLYRDFSVRYIESEPDVGKKTVSVLCTMLPEMIPTKPNTSHVNGT